jgi:redox-regulated HSP33 family molecular chaperone
MEGYYCVFDKDVECSVKNEYKLTPESLNDYCKICAKSGPNQQQGKIMEMVAQVAAQFLSKVMDSQKEKEQLQYNLGRMTATVELLQSSTIEDSVERARRMLRQTTQENLSETTKKMTLLREEGVDMKCPHCGNTYQHREGIARCPVCGWT